MIIFIWCFSLTVIIGGLLGSWYVLWMIRNGWV